LSEAPPKLIARRGLMLVLSSPSGAGKTTIANALLDCEPAIVPSVSLTTRPPRPGETDGVDYYFVSRDEFERRRAAGELLESAEVFGNFYGTPRGVVEDRLAAGGDVLFDVDWQGARQLRERAGADMVSVFVLPPSAAALEQRLIKRAQDTSQVVAGRMARASDEIGHWQEYDYVIVNVDVGESVGLVSAILTAERARCERQRGLAAFIADLRSGL